MRTFERLLVMAICAASAALVTYWGGQDKQGRFRDEYLQSQPGMILFFVGPYLLLVVSSFLVGRDRRLAIATLVATVVMAAIGLSACWSDHRDYMRTPPGREVMRMTGFLATLLLWVGSIGVLIAVVCVRLIGRARRAKARPNGPPTPT
jgi:formate hydrogenlyase subunit 3/multisubunit Na+/H+ antiporter MnhD subunit